MTAVSAHGSYYKTQRRAFNIEGAPLVFIDHIHIGTDETSNGSFLPHSIANITCCQ